MNPRCDNVSYMFTVNSSVKIDLLESYRPTEAFLVGGGAAAIFAYIFRITDEFLELLEMLLVKAHIHQITQMFVMSIMRHLDFLLPQHIKTLSKLKFIAIFVIS